MTTNLRIPKPLSRNPSAKMGLGKTFADGFRDWEIFAFIIQPHQKPHYSHIKLKFGEKFVLLETDLGAEQNMDYYQVGDKLFYENIDFVDRVGGFFS